MVSCTSLSRSRWITSSAASPGDMPHYLEFTKMAVVSGDTTGATTTPSWRACDLEACSGERGRQPELDRQHCRLGAVGHTELCQHVRDTIARGLRAQAEDAPNFGVGLARGDLTQHV